MSDFTVDSLKEYFEALRRADKKAVETALIAADKRLDLLNELRSGVATTDQLDALEKVVDDLKDRLNIIQGSTDGSELTKANIVTYLTIATGIIGLIILGVSHNL